MTRVTQVTALEIAQLKRVSKGTPILLLDKSGGQSKSVAKELNSQGYRNVYVVSGGFNSWTSSKLATKVSTSFSNPEILAPVFGTFRTVSGNNGRTVCSSVPAPVHHPLHVLLFCQRVPASVLARTAGSATCTALRVALLVMADVQAFRICSGYPGDVGRISAGSTRLRASYMRVFA